jgi:thymidylate synthase
MSNIEHDYLRLLKDILDNGVKKEDRTGTGTISVFGRQIRHKMSEGFPLLTTKKMPFNLIATELIWFLMGDTNIKFLVDNNCHIWDGDAYKNYCVSYKDGHEFYEDEEVKRSYTQEEFINKIKTDDEFAKKWGDLGPVYGKQWREWNCYKWDKIDFDTRIEYTDQIANLIDDLKTNPDSRRLMVTAWNPAELDQMTLPPCHYGFQCYVRDGKYLSLMWNQRSVDTFLGLPFNIASYGLLLEMIAREVNMIPDELIGNLGDVHLYSNHIEQAREQIIREPYSLPTLKMSSGHNFRAALKANKDEIDLNDFILLNYNAHSHIKAPLSN